MEVIVFGGGEIYRDVFNAIALMAGTNGISSLIRLVMVLGLLMGMVKAMTDFNVGQILKWFLAATIIYGTIWIPKVTIQITDRTNASIPGSTIANVPLGVGWIASVTSTAGARVIDLTETAFNEPNDVRYSSHGMIFGAKLMESMASVSPADARFDMNLQQFYKDCVFYDISTGYYSVQELGRADDLWHYITQTRPTNPARYATHTASDGTTSVVTCADMATTLTNDFNAAAELTATAWGRKMNPDLPPSTPDANIRAKLLTQMQVSNLMTGQSNGALDTVKQVMAVNAMRRGVSAFSAEASGDAMQHFVEAQQEIHTRNSQKGLARVAEKAIPMMKIVVEVLFIGMFPVLFPAFLLPGLGVPMMKGYFGGFLYLQLWGPMYVILHKVTMVAATGQTQAAGFQPGAGSAIRLSTIEAISSVNADIAATAGAMTMMIPVLAAGLTKGAMAVGQQGEALLGQFRGGAESAASVKSTGNLSVGNTAFENHSWKNLSANRRSTSSFSDESGNFTEVHGSGATTTSRVGGASVDGGGLVSMQTARSTGGRDLALTEGLSKATVEVAEIKESQAKSVRAATSDAVNQVRAESTETARAFTQGTTETHSKTAEQSARVSQQRQWMTSAVDTLVNSHGFDESKATQLVGRIAGGVSTPGKEAGGFSASAGGELSRTGMWKEMTAQQKSAAQSLQQSWSELQDRQAAKIASDNFSKQTGYSVSDVARTSESLSTTAGLMRVAEMAESQSRDLTKRADMTKSASLSDRSDLNGEFYNFAYNRLTQPGYRDGDGNQVDANRATQILSQKNDGDRLIVDGLVKSFLDQKVMSQLKEDPLLTETRNAMGGSGVVENQRFPELRNVQGMEGGSANGGGSAAGRGAAATGGGDETSSEARPQRRSRRAANDDDGDGQQGTAKRRVTAGEEPAWAREAGGPKIKNDSWLDGDSGRPAGFQDEERSRVTSRVRQSAEELDNQKEADGRMYTKEDVAAAQEEQQSTAARRRFRGPGET